MCSRVAGAKSYELTDHLGNVKAVVSDRKKLSDEVREYRYSYGFESDQDQPGPLIPGWSWTFSTDPDLVYRGDRSTGVTGHAHIFVMDVQPGDTVSAEVMMKFTTGARGGYLYTAYQDANGENEIGASSDLYDLAAHQRINEWSKIYQPANVVPNGKYKLIVYLRGYFRMVCMAICKASITFCALCLSEQAHPSMYFEKLSDTNTMAAFVPSGSG